MAGRARYHALKAELEFRTRKTFEDEPDRTHLDYVCDWLENGRTAKELAQELSDLLEHEISATRLTAYLTEAYGDHVQDRLWEARKRSAPAHAETAVALVDQDADDSVQVSRNRERARTRQWMAERYDSQRFGNNKHSVTINVAQLHVDAFRALKAQPIAMIERHEAAAQSGDDEAAGPASTYETSPARLIDDSAVGLVSPDVARITSTGSSEGDSDQDANAPTSSGAAA